MSTFYFCDRGKKDIKIILSDEHEKMEWVNYNNAMKKLKYDSNKTALWELNERLKNRRKNAKI